MSLVNGAQPTGSRVLVPEETRDGHVIPLARCRVINDEQLHMKPLSLLDYGLFPKELPPSFSSGNCSRALATLTATPQSLRDYGETSPVRHSLARLGGTRRLLAIPNPIVEFPRAGSQPIGSRASGYESPRGNRSLSAASRTVAGRMIRRMLRLSSNGTTRSLSSLSLWNW